jgi:hypothetical protein
MRSLPSIAIADDEVRHRPWRTGLRLQLVCVPTAARWGPQARATGDGSSLLLRAVIGPAAGYYTLIAYESPHQRLLAA